MPRAQLSDAHLSIRLIWPFARLVGSHPGKLATLSKFGIGAAEYANPDTRIPHRVAIELLKVSVQASGDPTLGLRAGALVESGDFDALEYAARSCATMRDAVRCVGRYARIMNDAAEISLVETDDDAIIRYRQTNGLMHPAANDFVVSAIVTHGRRYTGRSDLAAEIQFAHAPTTYLDEYARVLGTTKISFDAPFNAILFPRQLLEAPMLWANPRISAAFELHVKGLLQKLEEQRTTSDKVRELVATHLSQGDIGMQSVAKKLAMSVATLRRRLEEEGRSYSEIVDGVRAELAQRYLGERDRAISEVAFLLGFAETPSFYKAFKRWTGVTPAEYRARETEQ